jgi:hypothetical protein
MIACLPPNPAPNPAPTPRTHPNRTQPLQRSKHQPINPAKVSQLLQHQLHMIDSASPFHILLSEGRWRPIRLFICKFVLDIRGSAFLFGSPNPWSTAVSLSDDMLCHRKCSELNRASSYLRAVCSHVEYKPKSDCKCAGKLIIMVRIDPAQLSIPYAEPKGDANSGK